LKLVKRREVDHEGQYRATRYLFQCPGCDDLHLFYTDRVPDYPGPVWKVSGEGDCLTVTPSLIIRSSWPEGMRVCHLYVKEGKIQFLADCTHHLKGQTVEIPNAPEWLVRDVGGPA